jgi:aspartyl-tRNA(Asn)/glutamyl-tRNA(Gln) amidotransferase subunit B
METRHFDSETMTTKPMRVKEVAEDYRYFPEPDLVPMIIDKKWIEEIKKTIPELPHLRAKRIKEEYNLPSNDIQIITSTKEMADFFEFCVKIYPHPKKISNWIIGDMLYYLNQEQIQIDKCKVKPKNLVRMLRMIDKGLISSKIAKSVFKDMFKTGEMPETIVKKKGLEQISDSEKISNIIDKVINENPDVVKQYLCGKEKVFEFFVGQVMKKTKGKANPKIVNDILKKKLKKFLKI